MIKVLIADDSPTVRALVRAILESDRELEVVGEASNGEDAVAMCRSLQPDIATMDIQMPTMDGFEAIRRIIADRPLPIIVLTSTESDRELGITYKGIEAGAMMVLGKPRGLPGVDREAEHLILHVKALAAVKTMTRRRQESPREQGAASATARVAANGITLPGSDRREAVRIVAIGTSTGGPPALQVVFSSLPADFPVPILVVQHMGLGFISGLARWLDESTPIRVKVAEIGEILLPATAYLAPDLRHLLVTPDGRVSLQPGSPIDRPCPSVTALFASVAKSYGPSAIAALLTGMGRDGAAGLLELRRSGALTLAQDEATSVVFGMAMQAIAMGAAAEVLPLDRIGPRLCELAGRAAGVQRPQFGTGGGR